MSFEIRERDLLGRIGRLETKSGVLETPLLLPVINPAIQPISPKIMREEFRCEAIITNAYIIKKHYELKAAEIGIHQLLNFKGAIMTDSGAYQILVYGDVETTNREIVGFQEQIGTDIATMLDVPTGWAVPEQYAKHTVEETLKRAKELVGIKSQNDILWVGPIQGGIHLNWVAESAKAMSKLPFQIHALGSPTPVMERYLFDILVDMVMAAKQNLPPDRALHLFGAGHPFMFALAVALGCDLFDSAAYAIYAHEDRYMTETGTERLMKLQYFPCSCFACAKTDPSDVREMPKAKRQEFLARHNLYVSQAEIKRIKQAILEGRIWEHLETRSYGHPSLLQAFRKLGKYVDRLETDGAASKKSGLFFFNQLDLTRPEVLRHSTRLSKRYVPPRNAKILLLLPQTQTKPFHNSREHNRIIRKIEQKLGDQKVMIHICTYAVPFGVIPIELDEVYPLSQYEVSRPFDPESIRYVAEQVKSYIATRHYSKVLLLQDTEVWKSKISSACNHICKEKQIPLTILRTNKPWNKSTLNKLIDVIVLQKGAEKRT
jgi:7-cyano-7-deazaguanine tRNA-ribosyltransferase